MGGGGGSFKYVWERSAKILQRVHNRPISYALLSFGSSINLTSRESVGALGELRKKSFTKIFFLGGGGGGGGGGGSWNVLGGGGGGGHWI